MAHERMLDKKQIPDNDTIRNYIGNTAYDCLNALEAYLTENYEFQRELRFPFGNNYGWGYKYSHRKKHLMYVFFQNGSIAYLLQLGEASRVEKIYSQLNAYTREHWDNRYPCGKENGGWITCTLRNTADLNDLYKLIAIKAGKKKSRSN